MKKGSTNRTRKRAAAGSRLEKQAVQAGKAFIRGDKGLQRFVSPTAAANYAVTDSRSRPLPSPLRASLETAFDTDLSAVRIHDDPVSHRLTASENALAFTSGVDIFFASNRYAPGSEAGSQLIAHEVTHVLQQTGRRSTDGRLTATAGVSGIGPVQYQQHQPALSDDPPDSRIFDALVIEYQHEGTAEELDATIEQVRTLVNGGLVNNGSRPRFGQPLAQAALRDDFKRKPGLAKGFVIDCLKLMGFYAAAKQVIDWDGRLQARVLIHRTAFDEFLRHQQGAFDWAAGALWFHDFNRFWPGAIVRDYREFLLSPHSPPPVANARILEARHAALQARIAQSTEGGFLPQERVLIAWDALAGIDRMRVTDCQDIRNDLNSRYSHLSPTERLVQGISDLKSREQHNLDAQHIPHWRKNLAGQLLRMIHADIEPLWGQLKEDVADLRVRFNAFTADQLLDVSVTRTGGGPSSGVSMPRYPARGNRERFIQPLHQVVLDHARILFGGGVGGTDPHRASTGADLPEPEVYHRWLTDFGDALGTPHSRGGRSLLDRIDRSLRAQALRPRPNRALVRGLALMSWFVDMLVWQAGRYDPQKDEATPHFPDELGLHRLRMAMSVLEFARWVGWRDVVDATRPALSAGPGTHFAQLWIRDDWHVDPESSLNRLMQDFPGLLDKPFTTELPFTLGQVVRWFRLSYVRRLQSVLLTYLAHESSVSADTTISFNAINHLRQRPAEVQRTMLANAEAEYQAEHERDAASVFHLTMPQRFVVNDWQARMPADSPAQWADVVYYQPKTQLSIDRHVSKHLYNFVIVPKHISQGVFLWVLPSLRGLVELAHSLPSLRHLVGPGASDIDTFLTAIQRDNLPAASWQFVNERINAALLTRTRPIERQLPDLWRRFTTLQRRILVLRLKRRFAGYLPDRRITGGPLGETTAQRVRRISTPEDALTELMDFRANVRPRADADAQVALLVLSMATEFDRLFTPVEQENRVARQYYDLFSRVLQFTDPGNANNLRKMQSVTNEYDEMGGRIAFIARERNGARARLRHAQQTMTANYATAQNQIGFEGADVEGQIVIRCTAFRSAPIYPTSATNPDPGRQWHIGARVDSHGHIEEGTGQVVRILRVFRRFEYRPAVGDPRYGPYVPPYYKNSEGEAFGGTTGKPLPNDALFIIQVGEGSDPRTVRANDPPDLLTRYNDMFLWRGFQIHMEDLAAVTQASMEYLMTAVQMFVPEVMYAQIITETAQFVVSGELQEVVRQLKNDPLSVAKQLAEKIEEDLLDPDKMWQFLLLAGQHRNPLSEILHLRSRRSARRPPPARTRIGRIIRSLRMLGARFFNAVARLRRRAQGPIRSVQGNLAMHPTLSWVMKRAVQVAQAIRDLAPPDVSAAIARGEIPTTPAAISAAAHESIHDAASDLRHNTIELLGAIESIELPGELIDLTLATELIVQLVADRFGPKARIVRMALQLIPIPQEQRGRFSGFQSLYSYLSAQIARLWRDTALDPNKYWRDDVLEPFGGKFVALRQELVDGLYGTINEFLGTINQAPLERPQPSSLPRTEIVPESLEAEASFAAGRSPVTDGSWSLPRGDGIRIPRHLRGSLESKFNQDFSHVRLHTGEAAATATVPIGADAVTSGSHIYLHPRIDPAAPGSRPLLAHELTHVIQQTGSFPRGALTPSPKWGRSGKLRRDPRREHEATTVERNIGTGAFNVPDRAGGVEGVQPSLSDRTISSIIDTLTEVEYGPRAEQAFTASSPGASPVQGVDRARALWGQVWAQLGLLHGAGSFARFIQNPTGHPTPDVRERIKDHLRRDRGFVDRSIVGIATLAQRPVSVHGQNQAATRLDVSRFINLLENFIFAEKGIALQISLSHTEPASVHNVKVINVALERIGGRSALWDIAVQAGFAGKGITIDGRLKNAIRQRLRAMGPQPRIWDSHEFKFSSHFVDEFIRIRQQALTGNLTDVPTRSNYTDTSNRRADSLAVSTHGHLYRRGIGAYHRESHHTTQFLLAQFFSNRHPSRKAFPSHHSAYPDAVRFKDASHVGGEVTAIDAPGRRPVEIADLDPDSGRGNNMPAILLAARTHRRGKLHILRESIWNDQATMGIDVDDSASQGIAIENTFTRNLPTDLRPRGDSVEHQQTFQHSVTSDPARANQKMYEAVIATYHWMYGRMMPQLENGLKTEELAYYRSIAAINHSVGPESDNPRLAPEYNLTKADMDRVFRVAKANNDRVMDAKGWPSP